MSSAMFNVISKIVIDRSEFLVLASDSSDLLGTLINLIDPKAMGILGLIEDLCQVIVSHDFRLRALVVVDRLRFELLRQPCPLSNVLLQVGEIGLRVRYLCLKIGYILQDVVNVSINLIVLVLIGHDLFLQQILLSLQLQ